MFSDSYKVYPRPDGEATGALQAANERQKESGDNRQDGSRLGKDAEISAGTQRGSSKAHRRPAATRLSPCAVPVSQRSLALARLFAVLRPRQSGAELTNPRDRIRKSSRVGS